MDISIDGKPTVSGQAVTIKHTPNPGGSAKFSPIRTHTGAVLCGVNGHANPVNSYVPFANEAKDVGASITRMDTADYNTWAGSGQVYTSLTKWTAANGTRAQLDAQRAAGVAAHVVIPTPLFNTDPASLPVSSFTKFVTQVAQAIEPYTNLLAVGNECTNVSTAFGNNYLSLMSQVIPAVKAVSPNVKFVAPDGTWGFSNLPTHQAFWADSRSSIFDIGAAHMYDKNRNPEAMLTSGLNEAILNPMPKGKPRWCTEWGWTAGDAAAGGGGDGAVAALIVRHYLICACLGWDALFVYQIIQNGGQNYYLFNSSRVRMPEGDACKSILPAINAADSQRLYNSGTFWAVKLSNSAGEKLAVWDTSGSTQTINGASVQCRPMPALLSGSFPEFG